MTTTRTYGLKPSGKAHGGERWSTITTDDGTLTVTGYEGWGIVAEARLNGNARLLAEDIAVKLAFATVRA